MDRLGTAVARMQGARMESLTFATQSTPADTPVIYTDIQGCFLTYTAAQRATGEIDLEDRQCWVQTQLVTWTPSKNDTIQRSDGTIWKILSIADGQGKPAYRFQCRLVG